MALAIVLSTCFSFVVGDGAWPAIWGLAGLGVFVAIVVFELRAHTPQPILKEEKKGDDLLVRVLETVTMNAQALTFIVNHIQQAQANQAQQPKR